MTLDDVIAAVKERVTTGRYVWCPADDPRLTSLPPGLWLLPGPARNPADLIHRVPPWPCHPLEVVASPGCYGDATEPTREQCESLMACRGRFAVAMNVWGKALGVSPRLASLWFHLFTPLNVPTKTVYRRVVDPLREIVWTRLGFTDRDARVTAGSVGTQTDPPVSRPDFWSPEHVEYPADVDRVHLDRGRRVPAG